MKTQSRKLRKPSLSLIVFITFFSTLFCSILFFCAVVYIILCNINSNKKDNDFKNEEYETYRFLQLNHKEERIGRWYIQHPKIENEVGFVTYLDDEDGTYSVISSLGTNEYKCSGVCFCDEDLHLERRSISFPLSRVIFTIIASTSSLIATKMAKDFFETTCIERFGDGDCSTDSNIRSEVNSCDDVFLSSYFEEQEEEEEDDDGDDDNIDIENKYSHLYLNFFEKYKKDYSYECFGRCMVRKKYKDHHDNEKGIVSFWEDSILRAFSRLDCKNIRVHKRIWLNKEKYDGTEEMVFLENEAKEHFKEKHLDRFCKIMSTAKKEITVDHVVKELDKIIPKGSHICVPEEKLIDCKVYIKEWDMSEKFWQESDYEEYKKEKEDLKKDPFSNLKI